MAREHTKIEYARLLKEYLQKSGFKVGIEMEVRGEYGEYVSWDGFLRIARRDVSAEWDSGFAFSMYADASIHVDDDGEIRLHYHEPIIVNPEKKAKKMAQEALERERETAIEDSLAATEFDDEELFEFDFDEDAADEKEELPQNIEEAEEASAENYEYMSDEEELRLLRALNGEYLSISLHSPKNETLLYFNNHYYMDACSRNSAKKAASMIRDDLYCLCASMKRLSEAIGFERVKPEQEWDGWEQENVLDEFEQIDDFCEQKRAEAQKRAEEAERAEWEKQFQWDDQWGDIEEIIRKGDEEIREKGRIEKITDMFRYYMASSCKAARLEKQIKQQEQENARMQREIDQKKEELVRLEVHEN